MSNRTLVMLILLLGIPSGCGDVDAEREVGSRSEALAGSCSPSYCGIQSPDGCWCDTLCTTYGDCCDDYAVCTFDSCSTAAVIDRVPYSAQLDTSGATLVSTDPGMSCASGHSDTIQNENTVWFQFTAPARGTAVINTVGTSYEANVAVYTGGCGDLTEIRCEWSYEGFYFQTEANVTYLVEVADWYGDGGGGGTLALEVDFFRWFFRHAPSDARLDEIHIHPTNDNLWYVGSRDHGLLINRTGGNGWELRLSGKTWGIGIDPALPSRVYAGSDNELHRTEDDGRHWVRVGNFEQTVYDVWVSPIDGAVYVGNYWGGLSADPGIYKSIDHGDSWAFYPFDIPALPNNEHRGLIVWDITQDPHTGYLYVAVEPASKPSSYETYDPPTLRSRDGGRTWQDISGVKGEPGSLNWHATAVQVSNGTLFVQLEGQEVYASNDDGESFQPVSRSLGWDLVVDPRDSRRMFSSDVFGLGIRMARGLGPDFNRIGPPGPSRSGLFHLALNGDGSRLYAAISSSTGLIGVYFIDLTTDL